MVQNLGGIAGLFGLRIGMKYIDLAVLSEASFLTLNLLISETG